MLAATWRRSLLRASDAPLPDAVASRWLVSGSGSRSAFAGWGLVLVQRSRRGTLLGGPVVTDTVTVKLATVREASRVRSVFRRALAAVGLAAHSGSFVASSRSIVALNCGTQGADVFTGDSGCVYTERCVPDSTGVAGAGVWAPWGTITADDAGFVEPDGRGPGGASDFHLVPAPGRVNEERSGGGRAVFWWRVSGFRRGSDRSARDGPIGFPPS